VTVRAATATALTGEVVEGVEPERVRVGRGCGCGRVGCSVDAAREAGVLDAPGAVDPPGSAA
jgi:hypothetical protein